MHFLHNFVSRKSGTEGPLALRPRAQSSLKSASISSEHFCLTRLPTFFAATESITTTIWASFQVHSQKGRPAHVPHDICEKYTATLGDAHRYRRPSGCASSLGRYEFNANSCLQMNVDDGDLISIHCCSSSRHPKRSVVAGLRHVVLTMCCATVPQMSFS